MPWTGSSQFVLTPALSHIGNVTEILPSGSILTDTAQMVAAPTPPASAILLAPGVYDWNMSQIVFDQNNIGPTYVYGAGVEATLVRLHGSGDGFRAFSSKTGGNAYLPGGGALKGITFDGASVTGPGSSLVHLGDLFNYEVDFAVQNMPPAAGIMAWFDNQYLFMEQLHGRIHVHSGGNPAVQFDNSANISGAATGSFDRARLEILLDQKGRGNCVTFANGAFMTDNLGQLSIMGNTDYGASAFSVLTLTGSSAGGFSRLTQCALNIGVECNATIGTQPATITFGTTGPTGNQIFRCTGLIDFSANNPFAGSNNSESFLFYGTVYGDPKLQPSGLAGQAFKGSGSGVGGVLANGDLIATKFFGINEITTSGNVTGIKLDGFAPDDWRRISIMNNGTGTITFAVSGTSLVASGTACVIAANVCQDFIWNPDLGLWFAVQ